VLAGIVNRFQFPKFSKILLDMYCKPKSTGRRSLIKKQTVFMEQGRKSEKFA
jgi:hypothetical protein